MNNDELLEWLKKQVVQAEVNTTYWCALACTNSFVTIVLSLILFYILVQ